MWFAYVKNGQITLKTQVNVIELLEKYFSHTAKSIQGIVSLRRLAHFL